MSTIEKGAIKAGISKEEGQRAEAVVSRAVEEDAILENALNKEPLHQSGVVLWGSGGVLLALGFIISEVGSNRLDVASYNWPVLMESLGTLSVAAGVLYRRIKPGLRPVTWFGLFGRKASK